MGKRSRRAKPELKTEIAQDAISGPSPLVPELDKSRRGLFIVAVATVLSLLPFVGKAIHIDDPLFVWAAQRITADPFDPYGFSVNWFGRTAPMPAVMQNPPLTSYFLAFTGSAFGWSEVSLHLCSILFAVALTTGTWYLARRFVSSPALAAILTLFMPVVLVSSTNLMCDVPMTAAFVWAIALWIRGIENGRSSYLWSAGIAAAAAGLFKYFGISVVLLMLGYAIVKRRNLAKALPVLLLPIGVWTAYHFVTRAAYGQSLLLSAMQYASSEKSQAAVPFVYQLIRGLSFTGGCVIAVLIFAPALTKSKAWRVPVLAVVVGILLTTVAVSALGISGHTPAVVHAIIFVSGGVALLLLAAWDLQQSRSPESLLLVAWLLGTLIFAVKVNWTISGRTLLPIAAIAAILLVRRLEIIRPPAPLILGLGVALAITAFTVTIADYSAANAARSAARSITSQFAGDGHTIWFEGHWGFQYYMEQAGASPVDLDKTVHGRDLWVAPDNTPNAVVQKPPHHTIERITVPIPVPCSVMNAKAHAGFYSDFAGPLPFALGTPPPETYEVMRLGR